MARFSVSHNKAGVNVANTIMWQLRAGAGGQVRLVELALSVKAAPTNGPAWRLNRPSAVGTSSATVTPQLDDPAAVVAALARLDTAWSANPTPGADDLRQYATANSIGSGIVWTWYDEPLAIPAGGGLCIINGNATSTTPGTFTVYWVFDE